MMMMMMDDDDAAHPKNWFFVCPYSSNWNLEMLVFEERRKLEYPEKTSRSNKLNPHMASTDSNPGHIAERRVLSRLRQPCSPNIPERHTG